MNFRDFVIFPNMIARDHDSFVRRLIDAPVHKHPGIFMRMFYGRKMTFIKNDRSMRR